MGAATLHGRIAQLSAHRAANPMRSTASLGVTDAAAHGGAGQLGWIAKSQVQDLSSKRATSLGYILYFADCVEAMIRVSQLRHVLRAATASLT